MPLDLTILPLAQEQLSRTGSRAILDSIARISLSQIILGVSVLTIGRIAIAPTLAKTPMERRGAGYAFLRITNESLDATIYAAILIFFLIRPFLLQAFVIPSGSMWPTLYVNDFIVTNKAIYRFSSPRVNDIVVFRPPVAALYNDPDEVQADGTAQVDFVKRCVGIPGDLIELRNGVLFRNGHRAPDPFRHYSATSDHQEYSEVPEDDVLRMPLASFKFIKWKGRFIPLNYTQSSANASTAEIINDEVLYTVAPEFVIADPSDQQIAIRQKPERLPSGVYMMMGDNRNDSFDSRGWGAVPRSAIIGKSEGIWLPINRIQITR